MQWNVGGAEHLRLTSAGILHPGTDNTKTLGTASKRWSEIFAGNGTINTSDAREKTVVSDDDKVLDAVDTITIKPFKWNNSIESKGDSARIHYGVLAQEVKTAFEAQGLAAEDYGLLCYDEWPDQYQRVVDEEAVMDGKYIVTPETYKEVKVLDAGNRYGVRYDELYA